MLLGTHPIPARSPAEREGQNGKEMREGGREGEREGGREGVETERKSFEDSTSRERQLG